jgi:hypothetical protein
MTPPADPKHYKNHRFPGEIISHGVWLYYRFPLSSRDVQELLFGHCQLNEKLLVCMISLEKPRWFMWRKCRGSQIVQTYRNLKTGHICGIVNLMNE